MAATTNTTIGPRNVDRRESGHRLATKVPTHIAYMAVKCMPLTATPMISAATRERQGLVEGDREPERDRRRDDGDGDRQGDHFRVVGYVAGIRMAAIPV